MEIHENTSTTRERVCFGVTHSLACASCLYWQPKWRCPASAQLELLCWQLDAEQLASGAEFAKLPPVEQLIRLPKLELLVDGRLIRKDDSAFDEFESHVDHETVMILIKMMRTGMIEGLGDSQADTLYAKWTEYSNNLITKSNSLADLKTSGMSVEDARREFDQYRLDLAQALKRKFAMLFPSQCFKGSNYAQPK